MFFNNRRVEQDLEKIKKANLSPEQLAAEEAKENEIKESFKTKGDKFTAKDLFAMTIAILSLILPYLLIFGIVIALFFLIFLR